MLYHSQGLYVPGVVVPSGAGKPLSPLLRASVACVLSPQGQQMAQGAAYVS